MTKSARRRSAIGGGLVHDAGEFGRGGDRRRRSSARAEFEVSAELGRAAADISEVDRGGDRRRGAARPRAAPRPIGGDVVQTDRRTAATWCRPCRARAAPRPTSAQRSPSSTRSTPARSTAAAIGGDGDRRRHGADRPRVAPWPTAARQSPSSGRAARWRARRRAGARVEWRSATRSTRPKHAKISDQEHAGASPSDVATRRPRWEVRPRNQR